MTWNEILQLAIGSGGLIGVAVLFFRSGKLVQKVDSTGTAITKMDADIKADIKELRNDVSDIKERVSFMEAFIFFSEFTADSANPRSESARKMWERRRAKKVEVKQT